MNIIWASSTVFMKATVWLNDSGYIPARAIQQQTRSRPVLCIPGAQQNREHVTFVNLAAAFAQRSPRSWGNVRLSVLVFMDLKWAIESTRTMDERYGTFDKMRIGRGNRSTGTNQCHFLHYKCHMKRSGVEPRTPLRETGN
jgi:hypothetical protein